MHASLLTLTKTAYSEWKIQARQRTTWMLAGLFFLVGWFSVDHASLPLLSAISIARSTAQGLGLFGSLFVVILGATGFLREFQPTCDFLWARPFSAYDYIVGKYLGVCMGIGIALLPVGLWVAYLEATLHGFQGIVIQAKVWTIVLAPTLVSILAMSLLIGLILRRALWASLAMVFVTAGTLALNLDVTHLPGFAPYGIYVSPLIGYGPDSRLVWLHRAFYLELAVLCVLSGLLVAHFTAPRLERKLNRIREMRWGLVATGMLAVIFFTVMNFQHESAILLEDYASTPRTVEGQDCSLIQSYRAVLVLNLDIARFEGEAYLQLWPTSTSLQIPLNLNPGFQISNIQAMPQEIDVGVSEGALAVNLPEELKGQVVSLTLKYFGSLHYPRRLYDRIFRSPAQALEPFWVGGYLDGKTAFLTRDGNWHPFPGCAPDYLTVELIEAPQQMVHTADRVEYSDERVTLVWEQPPPLPLLAASQNYQIIKLGEATLLIASSHIPESKLEAVFLPYASLMSHMETCPQEVKPSGSQTLQIAVVPLLRYGRYDPRSRVLFLPEISPHDYLSPEHSPSYSPGLLHSPELLYTRWIAEQIMRLWWCSDATCPPLQAHGYSIGYVMLSDAPEYRQGAINALLTYASLRLAEPLVGQEFVVEEMAARQRMLEEEVLWTELLLPLDHSPDINRLVVQLHGLWEQTGPEPFWRLVCEYRRLYGTTSLPEDEFGWFVKRITGESLP